MTQHCYHIAAGLIRQNNQLLLIQQQGPTDPAPTWALPGGVVEDGELLTEALIREIREETGLIVLEIGALAYISQIDSPADGTQSFAFIFEIERWSGQVLPSDPDAVIVDAAFYPLSEAVAKVQALPWRVMSEPLIAYLQGTSLSGHAWLYRQASDGNQHLLSTNA